MKPLFKPLVVLFFSIALPEVVSSAGPLRPIPPDLKIVYTGDHLTLLTSGARLRLGRNAKSGIWDVPARKVVEMWVQRAGDPAPIRLDPQAYRRQLLRLLDDYPEVHDFIRDRSFQYRNLPQAIVVLDESIGRIPEIRREKQRIEDTNVITAPGMVRSEG